MAELNVGSIGLSHTASGNTMIHLYGSGTHSGGGALLIERSDVADLMTALIEWCRRGHDQSEHGHKPSLVAANGWRDVAADALRDGRVVEAQKMIVESGEASAYMLALEAVASAAQAAHEFMTTAFGEQNSALNTALAIYHAVRVDNTDLRGISLQATCGHCFKGRITRSDWFGGMWEEGCRQCSGTGKVLVAFT